MNPSGAHCEEDVELFSGTVSGFIAPQRALAFFRRSIVWSRRAWFSESFNVTFSPFVIAAFIAAQYSPSGPLLDFRFFIGFRLLIDEELLIALELFDDALLTALELVDEDELVLSIGRSTSVVGGRRVRAKALLLEARTRARVAVIPMRERRIL